MPPVYSCLHCQFLSHVLKALFFNQNSPKMKLFLQKDAKFLSAGGFAPRPPLRISGYAPAWNTVTGCHYYRAARRAKTVCSNSLFLHYAQLPPLKVTHMNTRLYSTMNVFRRPR